MSEPRDKNTPSHRFGVLLTVAYDGGPFAGFARQPRDRTVAGELDGAVRAIDPSASEVRGASRTDAGVHARGQVVAFDTNQDIEARGWVLGITRHLPKEIAVVRAARIAPGFVPRHRALRKTYGYVLLCSAVRDPFWEGRAWRIAHRLNHELLQQEAQDLLGQHDFRAFRASADERTDTVRQLFRAFVRTASGDERIRVVEVMGDRFMYRMMRIITGTLVDVAAGRLEPGAVKRALRSGSRNDLGITAPPDGLYLEHVRLDEPEHESWPVADRNID
ncbi:MAG TPA: tRNA pseudouridine(38-40) synthase TruA [Polyangiaceae bacterium]|nr:tRNA pseudouridine(38-40) synthase TruA [Polyangiaceae bacterium]